MEVVRLPGRGGDEKHRRGHATGRLIQSGPEPRLPAQSRSPWARSFWHSILQREQRGENAPGHTSRPPQPQRLAGPWSSEAHQRCALPVNSNSEEVPGSTVWPFPCV